MPIDTRSKRASAVGLLLPFLLAPPAPDGTIEQRDRQHAAHAYSGVFAAFPIFPQVTEYGGGLVEMCFGGSYRDWIADRGTALHHWYLSDILTTIAKDEITGYGEVIYDDTGEGVRNGIPANSRGILPEYGLTTYFDGVDDSVTLPDLSALPATFTIVAMVRPGGAGSGTTRCLVHTGPSGAYLGLATNDRAVFGLNGGTQVEAAITVQADEIYLLVGTRSGGNARLYVCPVDGSAIVSAGPTAIGAPTHGIGEIGVNAGTARHLGDLQGVAVLSEALALADIQTLQATAIWTDVSADVEISAPVTTNRGIHDDSPIARLAATGTATFVLDNSHLNSGGLEGYYSGPDHANNRAGFDKGIPVRVSVPDPDDNQRIQFIGVLSSLKPQAGIYRERRTSVTCTDWLDEAHRAAIVGLPIQSNLRPENLIAVLMNAMRHKPHSINFQTGTDTYVRALHTSQDEKTLVSHELKKIVDSEYGWFYMRGDGTAVFESRDSRDGLGTADHTMLEVLDVDQERARNQIKNLIHTTIHPGRVDEAPVVLYSQVTESGSPQTNQPLKIGVGAEVSIFLPFRSTLRDTLHGPPVRIGAIDIVPPDPVTDYAINAAEDGSGTDLTADPALTFVFRLGGNGVYLDITNAYGADVWFTHLQIRGRGVYDFQPIVAIKRDDALIRKHGEQLLSLDMSYQTDLAVAEAVGEGILLSTTTPATRIRTLDFLHAQSTAMHTAGAAGEIGQVARVAELMSGIDHHYDINGIRHQIMEEVSALGGTMSLVKTTWYLAPRINVDEDDDADTCDIVMSEDWSPGTSLWDTESQGGGYAYGVDGADPLYPKVFSAFGGGGAVVEADAVESGKNGVRPLGAGTTLEFRINNPLSTPDNQMPEGCIKVQWKILNEPEDAGGTKLFNLPGGGGLSLNCITDAIPPGPGIIINGFDSSSPAFSYDWLAHIGEVVEFKLKWHGGDAGGEGKIYELFINGVSQGTWTATGTAFTDFDVEAVNWPGNTWVGNLGKWTLCRGACE